MRHCLMRKKKRKNIKAENVNKSSTKSEGSAEDEMNEYRVLMELWRFHTGMACRVAIYNSAWRDYPATQNHILYLYLRDLSTFTLNLRG